MEDSLWAAETLNESKIGLSVLLELDWYQPVKQTGFRKSVLPHRPSFSYSVEES